MKVLRYRDAGFSEAVRQITAASSLFDKIIEDRSRHILDTVQERGDAALLEFTELFDGARLTPDGLAVSKAELLSASLQADAELRLAVAIAARNIEAFSRRSLRKNWWTTNAQGAQVGETFHAFRRVGIYVPGGTAPLISTALMTVTLARVAGCPEIVVCTPAGKKGEINPALLFALNTAGATEIYRLGGAQAVAALGFGTESVRKVQKVFGPGNAYVVAAKRLLFGRVAVDLLPGPSEVLVLADDTADARFVAADLLAQAEHGSGHERVWLITPSSKLLGAVQKEIIRQLPALSRREFITRALEANGGLIQVKTLRHGIELVNQLAPEHCEVMMRNADRVAASISTAGAIFLGSFSPTVLGDYLAGPSHELPTGGGGASFSGLTVDQFQRRTSIVKYDRRSLSKSLQPLLKFSELEGLDAHGRSAAIRLVNPKPVRNRRSARAGRP